MTKLRSRSYHPLMVVLITLAGLVVLHNSATTVFEAPNEVWHYAYVRWLVGGHGLSSLDDDASGANQEAAQPPLYDAVAALLSASFDDSDLDTLFWHNPHFGYQLLDNESDNKNMLIHPSIHPSIVIRVDGCGVGDPCDATDVALVRRVDSARSVGPELGSVPDP